MSAQFATTQWSDVLRAGSSSAPGRAALESLCTAYWYPLYAYVRRTGKSPDEARDLTQGFFEHLLEDNLLQSADPAKGRFRSFLLACMKNYLSNERQRQAALKRGGGVTTISLDDDAEERFLRDASELEPDALYDRRWSMTLMERAMNELERESAANQARWSSLKPLLTGGDREETYRMIGERLGMTENAVRVAVHRLRQRYGELLRRQIAETVADADQVDDELKFALLAVGPAGVDL